MRVVCPHCKGETILVGNLAESPKTVEEITAAELREALAGTLPRRRVSILYQAGLLVVAVFMVLLPVAYLALAILAGYGLYWYALHAGGLFSSLPGGAHLFVLKAILYLGPLIGGLVALFFMFKPILASRPKRAQPLELNPAQHPRLYQLIAHVSDLLNVRMPSHIYLDCDLSASAGFRPGLLSFLRGDLALNLGLPLVASLNARQFAAVVAHELGHCTQSLAMRLGYVINQVDRWFMRVVYERDTWDEALAEWADSVEDGRLWFITACAGAAVWCSRKILASLMFAGHAASCFLCRQMEFHADACAIAVAGSEALESSLLRLREQALLERIAYGGLNQIWKDRHQMPDSLPDFLDQLEQRLPADFHEQARLTLLNETAGLFATHPTGARRIQKARQQSTAGILALETPARALFSDFAAASHSVTVRHYRQNLRLAVTDQMLRPATDFFPAREQASIP